MVKWNDTSDDERRCDQETDSFTEKSFKSSGLFIQNILLNEGWVHHPYIQFQFKLWMMLRDQLFLFISNGTMNPDYIESPQLKPFRTDKMVLWCTCSLSRLLCNNLPAFFFFFSSSHPPPSPNLYHIFDAKFLALDIYIFSLVFFWIMS